MRLLGSYITAEHAEVDPEMPVYVPEDPYSYLSGSECPDCVRMAPWRPGRAELVVAGVLIGATLVMLHECMRRER